MIELKDLIGKYEVDEHINQVVKTSQPEQIPYELGQKVVDGNDIYELYVIDVNLADGLVILRWRLCS